jgi:2-haloacid dehalogenase
MLNFDQYKVMTFDCYGTLIDWESGILNALRPVLIAHQVKLHQDTALELFGELEAAQERGPYKMYRTVLENVLADMGARLGFQPTEEELRAFGASVQDWAPFADSAGALAKLKRKYKLVILSNVDDDLFAYSAQKLRVVFDAVITAQQCQSYKPSLNNFRVAEKRVGVPKSQWLHVAQSLFHDIAPAKQIGLDTVWVNRRWDKQGAGATPPTEATPDVQVRSLQELAELVRKKKATERISNT